MIGDNDSSSSLNPANEFDDDPYMILLFYLYHPIDDVDRQLQFQKSLCDTLGLNGRVRVSSEGLNVVLSGQRSLLKEYEQKLCLDGLRESLDISALDSKYCPLRSDLSVKDQLFPSLSVKPTPYLVTLEEHPMNVADDGDRSSIPARYLSPDEWNENLIEASRNGDAVLIDARNVYESKIGYFATENIPTILTNTRRYAQLPRILQNAAPQYLAGKNIFMYCTGGVRCERVSKYVQGLAENDTWVGEKPKGIYQLHGGIQRYLEKYGQNINEEKKNERFNECLFKGKNFVFDQRRTDPQVGTDYIGSCVICNTPHSDYDNGSSPSMNNEARCCRCRVLLLVCNACRNNVMSHGEERNESESAIGVTKQKLYCGRGGSECINEGNEYKFEVLLK